MPEPSDQVRQEFDRRFPEYSLALVAYFRVRGFYGEAEDLAGEVILRAWKDRRNFDSGKAELKQWLFGIARNVRHRAWKTRLNDLEIGTVSPSIRAENTASPVQAVIEEERQAKLRAAVESLDDKSRRIARLHFTDGLSVAEVAKLLGLEYWKAWKGIQRAKMELRKALRDDCKEAGDA